MALAVRYNGDPSGFLYGTNAFGTQGTNIDLSHYAYAGQGCQCAKTASNPAVNDEDCEDG